MAYFFETLNYRQQRIHTQSSDLSNIPSLKPVQNRALSQTSIMSNNLTNANLAVAREPKENIDSVLTAPLKVENLLQLPNETLITIVARIPFHRSAHKPLQLLRRQLRILFNAHRQQLLNEIAETQ